MAHPTLVRGIPKESWKGTTQSSRVFGRNRKTQLVILASLEGEVKGVVSGDRREGSLPEARERWVGWNGLLPQDHGQT